jgi:hypothetical protein
MTAFLLPSRVVAAFLPLLGLLSSVGLVFAFLRALADFAVFADVARVFLPFAFSAGNASDEVSVSAAGTRP